MRFTDEDLKRLKEMIKDTLALWVNGKNAANPIESLIARLECAEQLLDLWIQCDDDCEIDGSVFDEAKDAWLKSKGSDGRVE